MRFDSTLGRALGRFVVIADGAFWFNTPDAEQAQREALKVWNLMQRVEVWGLRENGAELCFRR